MRYLVLFLIIVVLGFVSPTLALVAAAGWFLWYACRRASDG